jgi:hypothetical protein
LVVDEDKPQPLPNLDYKIMQGNSLLESFEGIDLSRITEADDDDIVIVSKKGQVEIAALSNKKQTVIVFDKVSKEELYQLIDKYFDPDGWEKRTKEKIDKTIIKQRINEIVEGKIHALIQKEKRQLNTRIKSIEKSWKDAGVDIAHMNKKSKEVKQYLLWKERWEHLDETEAKLLELQQTEERPYFLWHLFFKDVFDQGGFDIVIGNPPYIQLQRMIADAKVLEQANYETFTNRGDIYCLFYEQGNSILKGNGILCYITSNSWMKTQYGELLRNYLISNTNPIKLLNFEDTKIFQTATVETNILIFQKTSFKNILTAVAVKTDYKTVVSLDDYFKANSLVLDSLNPEGWIILSKEDDLIKKEIEKNGIPLRDFKITINFGIKTGFNKAFIINGDEKNKLIKEDKRNAEIIKPLLRGRDLGRFSIRFDDWWLINSHNGVRSKGIEPINVKKDYPTIYQYLKQYKTELESRQDMGRDWTNLRNCAYLEDFEKPKILWGELSDKPKFSFDNGFYYAEATLFILVGENLKYLLSILNSRLSDWYFNQITTTSGMGTNRWKKYKIEQLPVPDIRTEEWLHKFETLADYLIYLNDESKPSINPHTGNASISPLFEDVLNMMVYELYFEQHMKEQEIDVLKYVEFKSIANEKPEWQKEIIGKVYLKLLEKENPIRNRIILSNIKSPNIIARINASTH